MPNPTPPPSPEMQALLDQLHGIIEPQSPLIQLAPGWIALSSLLLASIICIVWFLLRRQKRLAYRKQGLKLLESLPKSDDITYANQVNQLLKRIAIAAYGRNHVEPLHGNEWLEWLGRRAPTHLPSESTKHLLASAIYQQNPQVDANDLALFAKNWIKHHLPASQLKSVSGGAHV